MKNISIFYLKIFNFFVVKFSIYLNRRVFVMMATLQQNAVSARFLGKPVMDHTETSKLRSACTTVRDGKDCYYSPIEFEGRRLYLSLAMYCYRKLAQTVLCLCYLYIGCH